MKIVRDIGDVRENCNERLNWLLLVKVPLLPNGTVDLIWSLLVMGLLAEISLVTENLAVSEHLDVGENERDLEKNGDEANTCESNKTFVFWNIELLLIDLVDEKRPVREKPLAVREKLRERLNATL
jgi:hypothetical protein